MSDAYVEFKFESCKLKGFVQCFCELPQNPIVIFEKDGLYCTICRDCSSTLWVAARASVFRMRFHYEDYPVCSGLWISYNRSDLLHMLFHCDCGNEMQIVGCGEDLLRCDVCNRGCFMPEILEVRDLARIQALGLMPNTEADIATWRKEGLFDREVERFLESKFGTQIKHPPALE